MKWLWRWTGVDTNPFFERWLEELRSRKLFPALVPSLLAILPLLWYALEPHREYPNLSIVLIGVAAMLWLNSRAIGLGRCQSRIAPEDWEHWPAGPLSAYWSIALPPLIEFLPFVASFLFAAHGWKFVPAWEYFDAVSVPFMLLGGYLLGAALFGFRALRRAAAWLMIPVSLGYAFGLLFSRQLIYEALITAGYRSTWKHPTPVWLLCLVISLLPLLLAPGWLLALVAARGHSQAGFRLQAARSIGRAAAIMALIFAAGMGLSRFTYWYVPRYISPEPRKLSTTVQYTFLGRDSFLVPTDDGVLIAADEGLRELSPELDLLREIYVSPVRLEELFHGQQMDDGTLLLFFKLAMMEIEPGGRRRVTTLSNKLIEFLPFIERERAGYPALTFGRTSTMLSPDRIVQVAPGYLGDGDVLLNVSDAFSGQLQYSLRLDGVPYQRGYLDAYRFPPDRDELVVLDPIRMVLYRARIDGSRTTRRTLPHLPEFLWGSDLDDNMLLHMLSQASICLDEHDNVFFAVYPTGDYIAPLGFDFLVGVLPASGGPLLTTEVSCADTGSTGPIAARGGKLLIRAIHREPPRYQKSQAIISIPYEDLGIGSLAEGTPDP